jgi:hypothetical protein
MPPSGAVSTRTTGSPEARCSANARWARAATSNSTPFPSTPFPLSGPMRSGAWRAYNAVSAARSGSDGDRCSGDRLVT